MAKGTKGGSTKISFGKRKTGKAKKTYNKHDRTERSIFDLLPISPGIGFNHEGIQRLDTQCPRDNVLALNAVEQGKNHR